MDNNSMLLVIPTVLIIMCGYVIYVLLVYPVVHSAHPPSLADIDIPIGSIWRLRLTDGDPFPLEDRRTVTILDVKRGWVRYSMGSVFTDERKDIAMFLAIYTNET